MSHPWMPLYVSDYLGKTQRLTASEHGAYLLLIMEYWQSGGLPDDDDQLSRICRMTAKEWQKAKQTVSTFFYDGWHHERIEEELAKANAKHERRVEAGKRGGNASAENKQTGSNATSNAGSFAQASSSHSPSLESKPPLEAPPNKPKTDDVREAVAIYAQVALREETGWPGVQRLTGARVSACRARLAEAGGIEGWRAAMERGARSGFLCGRNEKGWFADFDFFCQSKSFTKLMEGSYDDRAGTSNRGSSGSMDAVLRSLAEIAEEAAGEREREAGADGRTSVDREAAGGGFGKPNPLEIPDYLRRTA